MYAVYEIATGALISTGTVVADNEVLAAKGYAAVEYEPNVKEWNPETLAFDIEPVPIAPTLRRIDFMRRFTADERVAIRQSANAYVQDLHEMTMAADMLTLDDADLVAGVNLLESLGIIAVGRGAEVLSYGN